MSLFAGNSSRKTGGRGGYDSEDKPPKSEATLLGDANQVLASRPDAVSRFTPETEVKADARVTPSPSPSLPSVTNPTAPDRCTNVVASGAKWQGTMVVDDSVRIDGNFSGEIRAKGTVHVSEGAQIDAKVRAQFVVISGTFKGEIRCEQRVDLLPQSRVSGELTTKLLSVQEGAVLDSKIQMTGLAESDTKQQQQPARPPKPVVAEDKNGAAPEPRPDREQAETPAAQKTE